MSTGCCPIGSEPALAADYTPKGNEENVDGLTCYVTGSGDKAIIVYYDVFGFNGGRIRLICDQLAEAGFFVVLPDIYHGDAWVAGKPMDELMEWLKRFPWETMIKDDTAKVLNFMESKSVKSIGCLGFCAGAWEVFHLCQNEKIKCGASMHPSVHIGEVFGDNVNELAESVKSPQLLYPAGADSDFYKTGGTVNEILKQKFGDGFVFKEFPEMNHGWVTRGDLSKPAVARDVKLAMEGGVEFFKKHL